MTDQERLENHARDIQNDVSEIMEVLQQKDELSERVQELEGKLTVTEGAWKETHLQNQRYKQAIDKVKEYVDSLDFEPVWENFTINKIIEESLKGESE